MPAEVELFSASALTLSCRFSLTRATGHSVSLWLVSPIGPVSACSLWRGLSAHWLRAVGPTGSTQGAAQHVHRTRISIGGNSIVHCGHGCVDDLGSRSDSYEGWIRLKAIFSLGETVRRQSRRGKARSNRRITSARYPLEPLAHGLLPPTKTHAGHPNRLPNYLGEGRGLGRRWLEVTMQCIPAPARVMAKPGAGATGYPHRAVGAWRILLLGSVSRFTDQPTIRKT